MKKVAVIVLYHFKKEEVDVLYKSLVNQVDLIVFSKNDNDDSIWLEQLKKTHLIDLRQNCGIAYAQNRGIEYALQNGADWILLSDQDTVYPLDYISEMLRISQKQKLENIGALVPVFYDEVKNKYSEVMITKTRKLYPKKNMIYKVAHAISSGTLIPADIFKRIGGMKEELFIDFVDFEWCWRLNNIGLNIFCLSNVVIHHKLGDEMVNKVCMKIVSRKLFRFYYIIRNGYYLISNGYLKGGDKILYKLLMQKKILEVLLLNNFSKDAKRVVQKAIYNGKNSLLIDFKNLGIKE